MLNSPIDYETYDGIAIISLNHPPVNSLSHVLRSALLENFDRAVADSAVSAILITGNERLFSAGADIKEFEGRQFWDKPNLPDLCVHLESCPKLLFFSLNQTAMGGALELALTGDYRLSHHGAWFGQPEVALGLIPGAGGTQRLPRRVDPKVALDMIVTGKPITAKQSHELNLVDHLIDVEADFRAEALRYIHSKLGAGALKRRCPDLSVPDNALTNDFLAEYRQSTAETNRGFYASEQCIRAVEAASRLPLPDGLKLEQELFKECLETPQHRAQKHLFFAERAARKIPALSASQKPRPVKRVGVVGSGTMGGGISMAFLAADIPVMLVDVSGEALQTGLDKIRVNYESLVRRGRMTQEQMDRQLAQLEATTDYTVLTKADLVIEAVFEKFDLKVKVFKELDRICKSGCILASNTSTLDINKLARNTTRPTDVVGMHFFSPANVMRLLEVVRGEQIEPEVLATALEISRRLRKLPIVVGVCYGFVGNRMMLPYIREAQRLVLEGAAPCQVDRALVEFGMSMGPLSMLDLIGLDVVHFIVDGHRPETDHDPTYAILCNELYKLGRYGQKSGRGYYLYNGREQSDDSEIIAVAEKLSEELGVPRRNISDEEILERCLYSLIDEGARILDEGIAYRAGDIDLVYTNGFGFPSWRGGPMHYAGEIGLNKVCSSLNHFRAALGSYGETWFQPSKLITELAVSGQTFSEY